MTDLPTVTFYLDRSTEGGPEEADVAYMTVTGGDWENLLVNGQYVFAFGHTDENEPSSEIPEDGKLPQGTALLPRFDTQGRLYTYTVREVIKWDGTAAGSEGGNVFTLGGSGQTIANVYGPETGALQAVKYLTVPQDLESYPAITLQLTRTYTTNDETPSESLTVQTQTWNAAEVKTAVAAATDTDGDGNVTIQHLERQRGENCRQGGNGGCKRERDSAVSIYIRRAAHLRAQRLEVSLYHHRGQEQPGRLRYLGRQW